MTDWLVAGLALILGVAGLAAAMTQADWPLRWSLANALERSAGRGVMRIAYVAMGLAMIAIGASILWQGFHSRHLPLPFRSASHPGNRTNH